MSPARITLAALLVACLLKTPAQAQEELAAAPLPTGLVARIELPAGWEAEKIDIQGTFHVYLVNYAEVPLRIRLPRSRRGYQQLSLSFTHLESGEMYVARRRGESGDDSLEKFEGDDSPQPTVEIAPGEEYPLEVSLSDIFWGSHAWQGMPDPNSGDAFEIVARYTSLPHPADEANGLWTGTIASAPLRAQVVASHMVTPQDYLRRGFSRQAIALMQEDPALISKTDVDGNTPLHMAAKCGCLEAAEWLLEQETDLDAETEFSFTPLYFSDEPEMVKLILRYHPDLEHPCDYNGQTPLQHAAKEWSYYQHYAKGEPWRQIVELYLAAGAEYDLFTAIRLADLDRVRAVLTKSPEWADELQRRSPLRLAASLGHVEICEYLLENFEVDIEDRERGYGSPVIVAALPYPAVVTLLMQHGADIDTPIERTLFGGAPPLIDDVAPLLHYAAQDGVPETIIILLDAGADVFARDTNTDGGNTGQTALEVAAYSEPNNAIAMLAHPALSKSDDERRQPLLDRTLVRVPITAFGAGEENRLQLMRTLLEAGANPQNGIQGNTALRSAARQIRPNQTNDNRICREMAALLKEYGAEFDLFSAVAVGDKEIVAELLAADPAFVDARDNDGYPALHFAIGMDEREIIDLLLEAGADVDILNRSRGTGGKGSTPLNAAAFWGRPEIAEKLLAAGAEVDARTENGFTPLFEAVRCVHPEMVQLLLEHGADPSAVDNRDKQPLDWLREATSAEGMHILQIFQEYGVRFSE